MTGWLVWIIIAACLFIAEMVTLTFYLLWLGLGALAGGLVAVIMPNALLAQAIAAAGISLLLIIFSKRISQRFRMGRGYEDAVDTLVGKTAVVVQDITLQANGIVKVGGDTWSATAEEHIAKGEKVKIVSRRSTVLHVKKEGDLL